MGEYCQELISYVDRMSSGQWLFVICVGVAIGVFSLRGLGSRSSY